MTKTSTTTTISSNIFTYGCRHLYSGNKHEWKHVFYRKTSKIITFLVLYLSRYYFWWTLLRTRVFSLRLYWRSKRPRVAKTHFRKLFQGQRPRKASGALSTSPQVPAKVLHLYKKGRMKPGVTNGECGTRIWNNRHYNFLPQICWHSTLKKKILIFSNYQKPFILCW
jgi:hypothetical protein